MGADKNRQITPPSRFPRSRRARRGRFDPPGAELRVDRNQRLAAAARPPDPARLQRWRRAKLLQATSDRARRDPRHRRDAAITGRLGVRRREKPPPPFIAMQDIAAPRACQDSSSIIPASYAASQRSKILPLQPDSSIPQRALRIAGWPRGARASAKACQSMVWPQTFQRPSSGLRNKAPPTRPATTAPETGASQKNQS